MAVPLTRSQLNDVCPAASVSELSNFVPLKSNIVTSTRWAAPCGDAGVQRSWAIGFGGWSFEHFVSASRFVAAEVPTGGKISGVGVPIGSGSGDAVAAPGDGGTVVAVEALALGVTVAEPSEILAVVDTAMVAPGVASTVADAFARTVCAIVAVCFVRAPPPPLQATPTTPKIQMIGNTRRTTPHLLTD